VKLPLKSIKNEYETFDVGHDEGMPMNEDYEDKGKFVFTEGQLYQVVFDI